MNETPETNKAVKVADLAAPQAKLTRPAFSKALTLSLAEQGHELLAGYLEKSKAPQEVQDLAAGLAWLHLCGDTPEEAEQQAYQLGYAIGKMSNAIVAMGGSFTGSSDGP